MLYVTSSIMHYPKQHVLSFYVTCSKQHILSSKKQCANTDFMQDIPSKKQSPSVPLNPQLCIHNCNLHLPFASAALAGKSPGD